MHNQDKLIDPLLSRLRACAPGASYPLDPVERELVLTAIKQLSATASSRTGDDDILDRLESSAAYMDEKCRDRFVVTAENLHGAIVEIKKLRAALAEAADAFKGGFPSEAEHKIKMALE